MPHSTYLHILIITVERTNILDPATRWPPHMPDFPTTWIACDPPPPTHTITIRLNRHPCLDKRQKKVSYDRYGVWWKCKINNPPPGVYLISEFKHHSNTHEIWVDNIPYFGKNCIWMFQENTLVTGWQTISFILSKTSPVITSLASFVKAKILTQGVPSSLEETLNTSLSDHQTWHENYNE